MTTAGTSLADLWPPEAIEAIRDASLTLLARAGVRVDSPAAADLLVEAGCTRGPQGRVLMPAEVVLAALESCPRAFTLLARDPARDLLMDPDPGPIYVHNMGEAPDVADARTGEARRATVRDQVLAARVMHHGRYPDSINPLVSPSDVPAQLHPLYSYLALHAETDKHVGGPGLDFPWQVRSLSEMSEAVASVRLGAGSSRDDAAVAGPGTPRAEAQPAGDAKPDGGAPPAYALDMGFSPVSPLHLGPGVSDAIVEAARLGIAVQVLTNPVAGTTARSRSRMPRCSPASCSCRRLPPVRRAPTARASRRPTRAPARS